MKNNIDKDIFLSIIHTKQIKRYIKIRILVKLPNEKKKHKMNKHQHSAYYFLKTLNTK